MRLAEKLRARKESSVAESEQFTGAYFLKISPTEFHTQQNCQKIAGVSANDIEKGMVRLGETRLEVRLNLTLCPDCTNPDYNPFTS